MKYGTHQIKSANENPSNYKMAYKIYNKQIRTYVHGMLSPSHFVFPTCSRTQGIDLLKRSANRSQLCEVMSIATAVHVFAR